MVRKQTKYKLTEEEKKKEEEAKQKRKEEEQKREQELQETFYQPIRDRLNETIDLKGLSQEGIAEKCGVSQSKISRVLSGPEKFDLHTFVALCKVLELKPDEVLGIKQCKYDKSIKNEKAFITDATHDEFQGYLGEYHAYFYSTKNKGKIHDGVFRIYKDRYSKRCLVSFSFKTGKKNKINKPVVKTFVGVARLSIKLDALSCEMVDQDNSGDVSYIIFNHNYIMKQQCACRIGMVVTICAGLKRLPVAHKLLICREELSKSDLYYIDGQLKLNDDTIHISEELYDCFKHDKKLPEAIKRIVNSDNDIVVAKADKQYFYTLNEDDIGKRKDISDEDKAKTISLLRKYSNSKRCKKIGPKGEEFVFDYIRGKKRSSDTKKKKQNY